MSPDEVSARFYRVLAAALNLPATALDASASRRTLAQWDSLRHMQLMMALEEDFGVEFGDGEIARLDSASAVIAAISGKLGGR